MKMCAVVRATVPVCEPTGVSGKENSALGVKSRHWHETLRVSLQHKTAGMPAQSPGG